MFNELKMRRIMNCPECSEIVEIRTTGSKFYGHCENCDTDITTSEDMIRYEEEEQANEETTE